MPTGPLSVPLPDPLRRRLAQLAKKRNIKLATAARALIDERLTELEQELDSHDEWQRRQVWETLDALEKKAPRYVSRESVHKVVREAVERSRGR